jgi:hypothetical protein
VTMALGGTRQKLSMIATVTNQGNARWTFINRAFNHERLVEFFKSLVKDTGKKILLILDIPGGPPVQASKGLVTRKLDQDGDVPSARPKPCAVPLTSGRTRISSTSSKAGFPCARRLNWRLTPLAT